MKVLVTGSAGHLGEGLMRRLQESAHEATGVDILASPFTDRVGSVTDRSFVRDCLRGVDAVIHAATLHKPHVATHSRQDFIDTNVTGTLNLLEEAVSARVRAFAFTSTTSSFGRSLDPIPGDPAVWVDEELVPRPKNVYGASKVAAEDLCELVHRDHGLPCLILRTSRFFPEGDDVPEVREAYEDLNLKANELLHRRLDLADAVEAHLLALERAEVLGFGRYVLSATTPFTRQHLAELRTDAPAVVERLFPGCAELYAARGWKLPPDISRVYVNARARRDLGWQPRIDFGAVLERLRAGADPRSELARVVGSKGYHPA